MLSVFPQGLKPAFIFRAFGGTNEFVPFQSNESRGLFHQAVKSCPFKTLTS